MDWATGMTGFWTDRGMRIDRMMWRFQRSGGFGNETGPYDALPAAIKALIHEMAALETDEVGLVAYFHSDDTWTLLTSDRLVGRTNGSAFNMRLEAIHGARSEILATPEGRRSLIEARGNFKGRSVEILLVRSGQQIHNVSIEGPWKSRPSIGLQNVLLMLMRSRARRI
jgi:hypothetical protein